MQAFAPYVVALLSLAGTALVAGFGFYQWRKQHGDPNRATNAEARRRAAENLWNKLEEVNLQLRSDSPTQMTELHSLLSEVNTLFLTNSFYLADDDQGLVNSYVKAMHAASVLVYSGDDQIRSEWQVTVIKPSSGSKSLELLKALEELSRLRVAVKRRLLYAVSG